MSVRFNPPPGWQVPPGFRPEAGWAPDPAWPPAPPGWEYWIEDEAPSRPTRAELREQVTGLATAPSGVRAPSAAEATTVMAPITGPPPAPYGGAGPAGHGSYGRAPGGTITVGTVPAPGTAGHGGHLDDSTAPVPPLHAPRAGAVPPVATGPGGGRPGPTGPQSRGAATAAADAARAVTQRVRQSSAARPANMVLGAVAISFLALGCILGVMVSVVKTSDASQAITNAERAQREARELEAEVAQEREDLDAMRKELEEKESGLRKRETDVAAKETELTSLQKQLDEQQAQQQSQGGDNAWFYWDCNAARTAGVAPIYQNQPGYRGSLDPNGNGIACEEGE